MKKLKKTFLITSIVLLSGIAFFNLGLTLGGGQHFQEHIESYIGSCQGEYWQGQRLDQHNELTSFELHIPRGKVSVLNDADKGYYLEGQDIPAQTFVVSTNPKGSLSMCRKKHISFFSWNRQALNQSKDQSNNPFRHEEENPTMQPHVILHLSRALANNLNKCSFAVGTGIIRMHELNCRELFLKNGNGENYLNNVETQNADLKTGMGNIFVQGRLKGESDIRVGMGDITLELQGKREEYSFYAKQGRGSLFFEGQTLPKLKQRKKKNHISLRMGFGDIRIDISKNN